MDQDHDHDLERCDDNGDQNPTSDDLRRQGRVNNWRHRTGLRPSRRIIRVTYIAKFVAGLVSLVGLLFNLFSILIDLVQVKYLNGGASPYITNPSSMAICLIALCIFALAAGLKTIGHTSYGHCAAYIINMVILISGVLAIAAIVSILVTNWLSWVIYVIWAIFSVTVVAWNMIPLIKQWWFYKRTENAFFRVINAFKRLKQQLLMINVSRRMLVEPQGPSNV